MSQFNATGSKAFPAGATGLLRYQRVKLNTSGQVVAAGADEAAIGFVDGFVGAQADIAIGDSITVRLLTSTGTFKAIAATAITVGATLYGGADGKVTATDGGSYTGRFLALEAGSGDGSIVEVLPITLG